MTQNEKNVPALSLKRHRDVAFAIAQQVNQGAIPLSNKNSISFGP